MTQHSRTDSCASDYLQAIVLMHTFSTGIRRKDPQALSSSAMTGSCSGGTSPIANLMIIPVFWYKLQHVTTSCPFLCCWCICPSEQKGSELSAPFQLLPRCGEPGLPRVHSSLLILLVESGLCQRVETSETRAAAAHPRAPAAVKAHHHCHKRCALLPMERICLVERPSSSLPAPYPISPRRVLLRRAGAPIGRRPWSLGTTPAPGNPYTTA